MYLQLVTDSADCVSLDELKAHLRIDFNDQDALLSSSISAARVFIEEFIGRAILNKTFDLWFDAHEFGAIHAMDWSGVREGSISEIAGNSTLSLRMAKVQSITDVKSYGQGNDELLFGASNYFLDNASEPARIVLNYGATWPTDLRQVNALKIRFVAGYGSSPTSVPAPIISAVKFLAGHFYETDCDCESISKSIFMMLNPYKVIIL
jgi:hypothetical protein